MPSPKSLTARLTLLASLLVVSACATRAQVRPIFPPSADLKAVIERKPIAGFEVVESAQAAAEFDAKLEGWGDRVQAAGTRICRWAVDNGAKLPFKCPAPVVTPPGTP